MLTTRQYLRRQPAEKLKEIFKAAEFNEIERELMRCYYIDKKLRDWICMKLNIGKTKYHTILNEALIKTEFAIKKVCIK